MSKPVPSAKQLEDAAFACTVGLVVVVLCFFIDAHDGVTRLKSTIFRLDDDPAGFRGALIMRWGLYAIMAAVGAIALGIGALVARGVEKASTDE